MRQYALLPLLILAAACSGGTSDASEAQADKLDNAAEQSTPAAAEVLEQGADAIRANGADGQMGQPGSTVQDAMASAGDAQATNVSDIDPVASPTLQSKQAAPHGAEKGNPPPKTESQ